MLPQCLVVDKAASPRLHDNDGTSPSELLPESGKKRRRQEDAEPRKKQRRPAQRGLCELNIDELYIVCGSFSVMS